MALGLAGLTAVPAAATDHFPDLGPREIRIFGADGAMRDFQARSLDDQRASVALVTQIDGATEGPPQAIEESAVMLPHYRIEVSHLGPGFVTAPWVRLLETTFIYFPGGRNNSFMVVEFAHGRASLEQRWILPDAEVAALFDRHLRGLRPIGLEPPTRDTTAWPWTNALGAVLLGGLGLRLFADPRRWRLDQKGRTAGKGTDQRPLRSTARKLPAT
jgi:hypothetical protein